MLHRIQLPGCVPQLEKIRQFQRDVLAFACSDQTLPLTEDALKKELGDERGEWLWRRLWKQSGKFGETSFHLYLIEVVKYFQQHPEVKQTILDAFDHDVTFHTALDDPDFHFQFNDPKDEGHKILKPLMVSFYEDLLAGGFETAIHGQGEKLNRDSFIESFWAANRQVEVCPACDRPRSDKVDNKVFDDADHYLPKSKYPFLSLHHANLVPLCLYCNRSFKGDRDPIDDHTNAPLVNMFHPYERPASEHMDILVSRDSNGVPQIKFEDRDGMPSRRVQSLKRVFRLHKRWPDQLRQQIDIMREDVSSIGRRIKRREGPQNITEEVFKSELGYILEGCQEKIGRRPSYILQTSYLTFALEDLDEFKELYRQFAED